MKVEPLIRHVNALAMRQHGLVRTDQVDVADEDRFRYLAKRGVVTHVAKGVYRIGGAPITWQQELQAGVWALGPTAVVSHSAAARLHGFDRFDLEMVEFTVDRACRGRQPSGIGCTVHTTMRRLASDRVFVRGLPTTSATRTILDLARARAAWAELEAAIDSAIRLRLTTLELIFERLQLVSGPARWGLGRAYALLVSSGGHTLLERRFLELVRRANLPVPTPQVVHHLDGRHVARVDFLFAEHGVVVEVSGGRGHSSPSERAKDARRRNDLQRLGRLVLEFTYEQVIHEESMIRETLSQSLSNGAFRRAS